MNNDIKEIRNTAIIQLKKTDKIIASNEAIDKTISEVTSGLSAGFSNISEGLQELCFNIDGSLREIADRLELQSNKLDEIKGILEKPLDTQAKELRKRAEYAYLNNWIDEAEDDLLQAEKLNYQDFLVHQMLGNLYYYHKDDIQRAIDYYQKAAKYSLPRSKKHTVNALIRLGAIYFKQNRIDDAFDCTKKAKKLLSKNSHVLYHYAGYAAQLGYKKEAIDNLATAIHNDFNFLIVADGDLRFLDMREELYKLKNDLREEAKEHVDLVLSKIRGILAKAKKYEISSFTNQFSEIDKIYNRNGYVDFLIVEEIAFDIYFNFLNGFNKIDDAKRDEEERAKKELKSAKDWSLFDYLGGWTYWIFFALSLIILYRLVKIGYAIALACIIPGIISLLTRIIKIVRARQQISNRQKERKLIKRELEEFSQLRNIFTHTINE